MTKIPYTEKQIEAANLLNSVSKGPVSAEVADEIITMIGDAERSTASSTVKEETEEIIKLKLLNETDWRKRVILSAMLISKSLK